MIKHVTDESDMASVIHNLNTEKRNQMAILSLAGYDFRYVSGFPSYWICEDARDNTHVYLGAKTNLHNLLGIVWKKYEHDNKGR